MRCCFKAIFVSEDGTEFLCTREYFCADLRSGAPLDGNGKLFQGRKFRLIQEDEDGHQPHNEA